MKVCGNTHGRLICDLKPGHGGEHRGHHSVRDEVHFWSAPQTPAFASDYQRMWDLVRHQRSELLDQGLITREEYCVLLDEETKDRPGQGSPSARRLESYDEVRAQLTKLTTERNEREERSLEILRGLADRARGGELREDQLTEDEAVDIIKRAIDGTREQALRAALEAVVEHARPAFPRTPFRKALDDAKALLSASPSVATPKESK